MSCDRINVTARRLEWFYNNIFSFADTGQFRLWLGHGCWLNTGLSQVTATPQQVYDFLRRHKRDGNMITLVEVNGTAQSMYWKDDGTYGVHVNHKYKDEYTDVLESWSGGYSFTFPRLAGDWQDAGFTPDEMREWIWTISPQLEKCLPLRDAGITPSELRSLDLDDMGYSYKDMINEPMDVLGLYNVNAFTSDQLIAAVKEKRTIRGK